MRKLLLGLLMMLAMAFEANAQCSGGIHACPPAILPVAPTDILVLDQPSTTSPTGFVTRRGTVSQVVAGASSSTRARLLANTTFYVAFTGVDSDNCTVVAPCATIQRAYDNLANSYDLAGFAATIQVADSGTPYPAGLVTAKCVPGANGSGSIQILGNPNHTGVVINATASNAFELGATVSGAGSTGCTQITIGGMKLTTTTSGHAISVSGGGVGITVGVSGYPIEFGNMAIGCTINVSNSNSCVGDHIVAGHSAWVIAGTNNFVSGSAIFHVAAQSNSTVALHGITETFSNSPVLVFYALAETSAVVYVDNMIFTNGGTVTGTRYFANLLGLIYACPAVVGTCSPASTYLPGNSAGVSLNGGVYLAGPDASVFSMANLIATAAAPTVAAGQIGWGGTTVAAGASTGGGTCPTGVLGGGTVAGCIIVNIAGTQRGVPFF